MLNTWRVATSIKHLLVKFPTEYKIGEAQGDQMAACECYVTILEMDDHLYVLNIEDRKVAVEPTEDLEEVSLDNNILGRTTHIGTQADPSICKEHAFFLKNNWDVFAWSHKDMLGISPNTMVHKPLILVE